METRKIFCDANVFVSHIKGNESQSTNSKELFERTAKCQFEIFFLGLEKGEIVSKFPYYERKLEKLLLSLKWQGKLVILESSEKDRKEALLLNERLRNPKTEGRFGFEDCIYPVVAKEHGALFLSWEKGLVSELKKAGFNAALPSEV